VVSIPLGYFGGIGAASRLGILFKGGNYLDAITKINTVVFDKTGTLTKGTFDVQACKSAGDISEEELVKLNRCFQSEAGIFFRTDNGYAFYVLFFCVVYNSLGNRMCAITFYRSNQFH